MASEEGKEEKPKSNMLLIIVLALVVLLGAGGAGAYFMFMKSPEKPEAAKMVAVSVTYPMSTFIVNLADAGSKRFLKATIELVLNSKEVSEECKAKDSELRDLVLTILSSQESGDVVTSEDKSRLKKRLLESLNQNLTKGKVTKVYFTDFLIQ